MATRVTLAGPTNSPAAPHALQVIQSCQAMGRIHRKQAKKSISNVLVGIIVLLAWEDLATYSPLVPVLSLVHAIITVGRLVGCHTLDVANFGPPYDDVSHSLLGAQVNLQHSKAEFLSAVQALNLPCLFSHV